MKTGHHGQGRAFGQARHRQMRLRHQQKQIFLALDPQGKQRGFAVRASQREIQQGLEILVARRLRGLESFNQMPKLGIEQGIDGGVRFGSNDLGAFEQFTVHCASEVDGLSHAGLPDKSHTNQCKPYLCGDPAHSTSR